jgi:hypothetical protein
VPAITLEGDANGAPHVDASAYAGKFSGKYEHRLVEGGVGHNLPQKTPQAFAQAVTTSTPTDRSRRPAGRLVIYGLPGPADRADRGDHQCSHWLEAAVHIISVVPDTNPQGGGDLCPTKLNPPVPDRGP